MKLTLIVASLLLSVSSFAKCDLAMIRGTSNGQTYNYNDSVLDMLELKGYRAYQVDSAYEAGLTNANYIGYFEASCSPSIFNPFMTSTVTTLTIAREKGIKYETMTKVSSAPQIAMGSCKVDLESLIKKVPACK